jgi:hypothetical protein
LSDRVKPGTFRSTSVPGSKAKDWVTVDELDVEMHFPKEGVVLVPVST